MIKQQTKNNQKAKNVVGYIKIKNAIKFKKTSIVNNNADFVSTVLFTSLFNRNK